MKTYRVSEAGLKAPANLVIVLEYGPDRHEVLLEEAAAYLRSTQGIVGKVPTRASLTDGRKIGAFPCIIARTELAAAAMSLMLGYEIQPGDGVRCCTQLQARERAQALHRLYGVPTKNLECKWMISEPEPELPLQPKPSRFTDEERSRAFEDSPF